METKNEEKNIKVEGDFRLEQRREKRKIENVGLEKF